MKKAIHLAIWGIVIIAVLQLSNWVYELTLLDADLEKYSPQLALLKNIDDSTDVLYLGDCSDLSLGPNDTSRKGISGLMKKYFPEWRINSISHWGNHPGIYLSLLQNLDPVSPVKIVIVTVNLRAFSPAAEFSSYQNRFNRDLIMMAQRPVLLNRLLLSMKWYRSMNEEDRNRALGESLRDKYLNLPYPFAYETVFEWDSAMALGSWKNPGGDWDESKIEAACYAIKDFAPTIDGQHPRVSDLDEIVSLAEKRNWKLIFNLIPENLEIPRKLVGSDLLYLIGRNRRFLLERYRSMSVPFLDNLLLLKAEEFIDENPNEHYIESGRKKIAESLVRELRNDYLSVGFKMKDEIQGVEIFSVANGVDSREWQNSNTASIDHYHSPPYSSKTDSNNPYSLTLSMDLDELSNFSKKWIEVSMFVFTEYKPKGIVLVFELRDSEGRKYWWGTNLEIEFQIVVGRWQPVKYTLEVPPDYLDARNLKTYVYNTGGRPFYIDDMKVSMKGR